MSMHELPPPNSARLFEEVVRDVLSRDFPSAQLHGRSGQKQSGIDIYFRRGDAEGWIGVQCKLRRSGHPLLPSDLDAIALETKAFVPELAELIIATTTQSDAPLQKRARELTEAGTTDVCVLSWDEISTRLMNYPDLVRKFYPRFWEKVRFETHRRVFGLGILVGALLESYFVLNHLDENSEQHRDNVIKFIKQSREEAIKVRLSMELEPLLESLGAESPPKRFFFTEYPSLSRAIQDKHGSQAKEYFDLALALQDCNLGLGDIGLGLSNNSKELIQNGKSRFSNDRDRIRSILPNLDLEATVKAKTLEVLDSLASSNYSEEVDVQRAAETVQRILDLIWATV